MSMSVMGLPSLMSVVAFSRSRMSNALPHTSGTPRSMLHQRVDGLHAVRLEYSGGEDGVARLFRRTAR